MDERTENRIQGWDSKPLTGGFAELRELADGGFSGAARTATTTLFMLNGRVVGVFGGAIEDFEGAEATAFQAPHPSLPLLFAMKERGGDQRAKYYTNDTPISEAHETLADAQFTGYIELSENVLSGDYFVVYYGGRSMSCAFVGNSQRLETGDEAFELADDEVGIYQVMDVDLEVTDIPEPAGDAGGAGAQEGTTADQGGDVQQPGGGTAGQDQRPAGTADGAAGQEQAPTGTGGERGVEDPPEAAGDRSSRREPAAGTDQAGHADQDAAATAGGERDGSVDAEHRDPSEETASAGSAPETSAADRRADGATPDQGPPAEPEVEPAGGGTAAPAAGDDGAGEMDPQSEAAADRAVEAASGPGGSAATGAATAGEGLPKSEASFGELSPIPSLSPDHTEVAEPGQERGAVDDAGDGRSESTASAGSSTTGGGPASTGDAGPGTTGGDGRGGSTRSNTGTTGGTSSGGAASGADAPGTDVTERATREVDVDVEAGAGTEPVPDDAGAGELRQELRAREDRIEELEAAITDLRVQRDGLTDERDRLQSEVDRLEGEVAELESEVERLAARLDDGTEDKQRLSLKEALEGTNLFVRYGSKSGGTLEKAHAGDVGKEEVNNNLRLEHHTQFETDQVLVEGEPFEAFLGSTIYRSFVEWIVRDLLYEIQDTGHVKGLLEVYDAIPRIDRAELLGDVSVQYVEDGEEYREQRSFDVVLRDRMGNPLIVANINDSRNPADREMMETIIGNAIDVKESNESLSSALMVTSSFFKPGALEAADESAGGGLLSRDAKQSYVKLNRKNGYHLVLVESREDDFHVNVPEL